MNIPLLSRQQFQIINRRTLRYPLQIAEKDYFLGLVMQIISASSMGKTLVFKGGTALNHCYLDQSRFSEDLDFSSQDAAITLEDVRKIFLDIPFLSIKKDFQSEATIKIEKMQFEGLLSLPNSMKVEIDHLQNVLLPPLLLPYKNVWGLDFKVNVMDIREICAEKIRAMSDRARYRDFYDLFLILEKWEIHLLEIVSYIEQKEIRIPISKESILKNWEVSNSDKDNEMRQIHYSREIDDDRIKKMIDQLPFNKIEPRKKK